MAKSEDYDSLLGLMTKIEQQGSEEQGKVRFLTFSCKNPGGRRKETDIKGDKLEPSQKAAGRVRSLTLPSF
jgi:hypothetical protein